MLTDRTAGTSSSVTITLTPRELSPTLIVVSPSSVVQETGPVGPMSPLTMTWARPGATDLASSGSGGRVGAATGVDIGVDGAAGAQPTADADTTAASRIRTGLARTSSTVNGEGGIRPAAGVALLRYCRGKRSRHRRKSMPIATPEVYAEMLGRAKEHSFAFPAINCVGSESVNAAIKGFADAGSDGIIQFSTGGAEFASGLGVKDMVTGAVALAEFAHVVAARYPITVALHTDHCPKDKLDTYVRPLLAISAERVAKGGNPLFQSHMWDGSAVPIDENLEIAKELLAKAAAAKIVLEIEIGVVGGEEDGVAHEINDKLYTTPEDFEKTIEALGAGEHGKYLLAATFGNVHGVYKPGNVKLRPDVLDQGQKVAAAKLGLAEGAKPFDFVFHGGSGSLKSEIEDSLKFGVLKMNAATDTQYAFTRPLVGHMFTNYDGVLKIDGEVGNKKAYDPRSYLKKAEAGMSERVVEACNDLHSAGRSITAG